MARGQEIRYQITADNKGFVAATQASAASLGKLNAAAASGKQATDKWSASASAARASAFKMTEGVDKAHQQALVMNKSFAAAGGTTGKLAVGFGNAAQKLGVFAAAAGLPVPALQALAAAENVAALGMNSMSAGATGLAAALGPVAIAIGAVVAAVKLIGPAVDEAMAGDIEKLPLEVQAVAKMALEAAKVRAAIADVRADVVDRFASRDVVADVGRWRGIVDEHLAAGTSIEEIERLYGNKLPDAIKEWLSASSRAAAENTRITEEWAREQQRLVDQAFSAWKKWQGLLKDLGSDSDFRDMLGSGPMAMFGLGKMPGEGSLAGMDNVLPPGVTRGQMNAALGRQAELDAGATFEGAQMARWNAGAKEATTNTQKWVTALSMAAHAMSLLGVASDSALGKAVSATASGAALGAQIGGGWGAVIGGGIGLLSSLFGGGPSAAEREAERKKAADERRRIEDAAREMRAEGIAGLGTHGAAFFGATRITDEDSARRQGTLFVAAWGAVVKEKGIIAAADAFGDAFAKMKADIEAAGIEAPAWMKAIGAQLGLAQNEEFRGVAAGAQSGADFLKAFGQSGGLTAEVFRAFEQEARAAFAGGQKIATEAGLGAEEATEAGFAAANPLLKALLDESVISGQTLAADIQAMVNAQGIVASIDVQQLDELRQIRAAVQHLAGIGGNGGDTTVPAPGGLFDGIPHAAEGKRIPRDPSGRGQPVMVGEREDESIVPDSMAGDFARGVLGGNAGTVDVALGAIRAELRAMRDQKPGIVLAPQITVAAPGASAAEVEAIREGIRREFSPNSPMMRRLDKRFRRN